MKKVITEKSLKNIVKQCVTEALKYDKERRQYYPDYTGNAHSDAGKFTGNYRDDFNYTRNNYKWSNPDNQKRFNDLQLKNDLEIDPFNSDRDGESNAYGYLQDHEPDTVVEKAVEELRPKFEKTVRTFLEQAAQKHPILKNDYYMSDFIWKMKDVLDEL